MAAILRPALAAAEEKPPRMYFAHAAVEDRDGVIAPWYRGLNGQCDFRIRVAAETLKRYPWADAPPAVMPAPDFVFNGHWGIQPDGTIRLKPRLNDWDNGDVGQRSASLLQGLVGYYRYTGDPAAIGLIGLTADFLLDYCQTPADHPWPGFLISCPTKGKPYGRADPHGFIQLDVSAQVGSGMVAACKLTGDRRCREAAERWADLLAEHCDRRADHEPWQRYANPDDARWSPRQTAGVSLVLQFLDDVIRLGHQGKDGALRKARDAGDRYLRDVLLPQWSRDPTLGHHFWDWVNDTANCSVPCYTAQYLMNRREAFPQWKSDVRNVLSVFFCRSSVDPGSAGGVYSGAWAFPESSSCCGKSLQYPTMAIAASLARYGQLARSGWASEVARRQSLLCTYDAQATGVVEDGIDGGAIVAGNWFNLAHPWPLRTVLDMVAWQPEVLGANRENHIVRSSEVVESVQYGKGRIEYRAYAAAAPAEDLLRLAFQPRAVTADGKPLPRRTDSSRNGFTIRPLANGDCLLGVRHDGCRRVVVEGDDPQETASHDRLRYEGAWSAEKSADAPQARLHAAVQAGARAGFQFHGNQVRLIGRAGPAGGKADVYLDGVKQLAGIDFWCPQVRDRQVLYYRNGLAQAAHRLEIVATGSKNPRSQGTWVNVQSVQWSAAEGESGFGTGGGPADPQRVIFGYVGRNDYVDSKGCVWRPATEFTLRIARLADLVPIAFWTAPRRKDVAGTADPEIYRYGVHGADFTAYFTVAPAGAYRARLCFCQAQPPPQPGGSATAIDIQDKEVATDMDVAAKAGGVRRAVDLVFDGIRPKHGIISIRFHSRAGRSAMIQAIEIVPGDGPALPTAK
jgi:hypothetical protein